MSKKKDTTSTKSSNAMDQGGASVAAKNAVKKRQNITPMGSSERRMGLRNLAPLVGNLTRPLVRKRGFFQTEIILHWAEIVGRDLEQFTMPVKYNPPRGENAGGGTLVIRVTGPVAIELQHRMPQIIDRVNTYFGYRAVARITMMQGDISRPERTVHTPKTVPEADIAKGTIANIDKIEDPHLREVLMRLGRHIAGDRGGVKSGSDKK
ncbi:DciA family protein [Thalassospira sp. MA62]|nr:DciA family protein [Thalassospira sp. MA62]